MWMLSWWRLQMKTFSALLALFCGEFTGHRCIPRPKPVMELWWFFFICTWINGWVNNREAVDLRRNRAHYNVTVICLLCFGLFDNVCCFLWWISVTWFFDMFCLFPWHRDNLRPNRLNLNDIDGLVQDCSNSIANALELLQSCTKPSIWVNDQDQTTAKTAHGLWSITWWRHQMETFSA